jgi:hypothetical protein
MILEPNKSFNEPYNVEMSGTQSNASNKSGMKDEVKRRVIPPRDEVSI